MPISSHKNLHHNCMRPGLSAIPKKDKKKIIITKNLSPHILESIFLDDCYKKAQPNVNRWDYIIFFSSTVNPSAKCIEVHSCDDVNCMEKKYNWLKNLILSQNLGKINDYEFIWVYSNEDSLPRSSRKFKLRTLMLARTGMRGTSCIRI